MSMEQSICKLVTGHWRDMFPDDEPPDSVTFLKIAGKTTPNAAIIALLFDIKRRSPVAIAKIPRNPLVTTGIENEYAAMVDIKGSIAAPNVLEHIPFQGMLFEESGVRILIQRAGKGCPMIRFMNSQEFIQLLYETILPWMFDFHADGARECMLEGDVLSRLIKEPIAEFMEQFADLSASLLSPETRQYLLDLPQKIEGRKINLCRQHGDFNAHNILVEIKKKSVTNFFLVDWEDYRTEQLPVYDLNHFFISNARAVGHNLSIEESFANLILQSGWYRDLYIKAVSEFTKRRLIDHNTFWLLTPLYLVAMCLRVSEPQRQQKETAHVWIHRAEQFIKNMSLFLKCE